MSTLESYIGAMVESDEPKKLGRPVGTGKPMGDDNKNKVIKSSDYPRLIALLKTDCLTHREIAKRFGVTGERIRQLSIQLGFQKRGRERRNTCAVNRLNETSQVTFDKCFARLIAACPVPVGCIRKTFHRSTRQKDVLIGGKKWRVYTGCIGKRGYRQSACQIRPCIVEFSDGFMVIPESAPRRTHLCFSLNPDTRRLTKSYFHDWPSYWNAWEHVR